MAELTETYNGVRGTVCFVTLELHPTTQGGTGMLIAQTAHKLLEQGYEVIFLFGASRQDEDRFRNTDRFLFPNPGNIRSYHVLDLIPAEVALPGNLPDDVYLLSIRFALALVELTRRHRVNLVEFYDYCGPGFHAFACPELMGQAMAVRLHSTIELIARRVRQALPPERMLHFHQEREQLRLADGLLYSGEHFFEREVREVYPFLGSEGAYASPPVLLGFAPCPPRTDARDLLFYGRLSTLKGLDTFLRGLALALAVPAFDNWVGRINVAGAEETVATGLTLDEMLAVVPEQHRARLNFLGHINHDELQTLLPDVGFAVFANKLESFCYAAHELRVSGTPLILNNLPTFHDFFAEGQSAVFFDGTASDLAGQMCRLAADPGLRERLSQAGIAAAPAYEQHRYGAHLEAIRPRRIAAPASALAVTALVFSTGDDAAEERTLASLEGSGLATIVLRHDHTAGWSIAGSRWRNDFDRPRAEVDMSQLGDAVIGLRAGEIVDAGWLEAARIAMASDPRLGALAGWRLTIEGLRTSASHLLPELALGERIGLGRLTRIASGLLFAELAGQMKHSGEVGLLLAARKAGLALAELPRVALDSREAVVTPRFDAQAAMVVESDRLDAGLLSLLPELARRHAAIPEFWLDSFGAAAPERVTMVLESGLCRLTARHDLSNGEVMILRVNPREGAVRTPWSRFSFWRRGQPRGIDLLEVVHALSQAEVVTFPATDETILELRKGPDCGTCEVEYDGRRILIDLHHKQPTRLSLRLGNFAVLADARASGSLIGRQSQRSLESLLPGTERVATLTVATGDGWIRNHSVPLGAPVIAPAQLLVDGVDSAAKTLYSWQRSGRVGSLVIAIESTDAFKLFQQLVEAGARNLTALLPGQVNHFEREGGYTATIMAAGALAALARKAKDKGWAFDVAGADASVAELISGAGAKFYYLGTPLPKSMWGAREGGLTVALVGRSELAQTRTHLVAAAMLLRRELGDRVRILVPAVEPAGTDLLDEFGMHAIERYTNLSAEFGPAAGPAVALSAFPDVVLDDDVIEATALGYLPVLGPSNFRWAQDAEAADDLARFRVEYWEDAQIVATAASALLADWAAATAAWERLQQGEMARAAATRAKIWGRLPEHAT